jgi:DNA-binding transcriptional LysR family regulator
MLPYFMARDGLASGVLEQLLPDFTLPAALVHVVFPSRRGLVPAVRTLLDALVAGFERPPGPTR